MGMPGCERNRKENEKGVGVVFSDPGKEDQGSLHL